MAVVILSSILVLGSVQCGPAASTQSLRLKATPDAPTSASLVELLDDIPKRAFEEVAIVRAAYGNIHTMQSETLRKSLAAAAARLGAHAVIRVKTWSSEECGTASSLLQHAAVHWGEGVAIRWKDAAP